MDEDLSIFFNPDEMADDEVTFFPDEPGSIPIPAYASLGEDYEYQAHLDAVSEGCLITCEVSKTPVLEPGSPVDVNGKRYKFKQRLRGDKRAHTLLLERDVRPRMSP